MADKSKDASFDYERLAKEFARASAPGNSSFDSLAKSAKSGAVSLTDLKKAAVDAADGTLKTWRNLSSSGANFSNDIIGMSASAAKSRMSLDEFGEVIQNNVKNLTGLGGNATRGAQAFAKLAEEMSTMGVTDNLRQLGYTSKEVSELLALQMGTTRTLNMLDEASRERAITAAETLGKEMDLTAKLTGKSRKEQEDRIKALQLDAQVENKIRLETRGMNKKDADAYRENVMRVLKESQERGTGEMAKERYATGTVTSEKGSMQAGMFNEEFSALDSTFKAIRAGQTELAKGYEAEAKAANLRAQDNPAYQLLGSLGEAGGPAAAAINQVTTENRGLYDATKTVKEEMGLLGTDTATYRKVLDGAIKRAQEDQQKKDGAAEAALAVGAAMEKGRATLATGLEASLKTAMQEGGKELAKTIESTINSMVTSVNTSVKALDQLNAGVPTTNKELGVIGQGIGLVKSAAEGLVGMFKSGDAKVQAIPQRTMAQGGMVDKPTIALVGEAGKEHIVPSSDMKDMITAATQSGMSSMAKMRGNPTGGMDGFDLSSISKDISTTISSVSGGSSTTTRSVQNEDSKAASKELASVKEQYAVERKALLEKTKEQMGPNANLRQISNAMRTSDEAKALEEKYNALMGPLEKQIEAGIRWEVETKQSAAEETKKIIESELLIKEQFSNKILTNEEEQNKKLADIRAEYGDEAAETYLKDIELKNAALKAAEYGDEAAETYLKDIELKNAALKAAEERGSTKVSEATPAEVKNPLLNDKGKISLNKLTLPGMPNFGKSLAPKDPKTTDIKSAADSISEETKKEEAKKAEAAKKAEDAKKAEAAKGTASDKPTGSVQQTASLNDVVKSLDQLNMQMGQLISQQSDLIRKQTSSMLAAGSNNVYDKTR